MGLYEIKKRYFDSVMSTYDQQYTILSEYQLRLSIFSDPKDIALDKYHLEKTQAEVERLEAELAKAEADVQKWATQPEKLFAPPPKVLIGGKEALQSLASTAPVDPSVEVPSFNPEEFGEVKVAEDELETLVNERAKYVEPVPFMNGLRKSVMGIGRVELNGEACGTAFLVGKNKVMTNWHVVRDPKYVEQLSVRFGHFVNEKKTIEDGQVFKVAKLIAWKPPLELDYALLELAGDPTTEGKFNVLDLSSNLPNEDRIVNILHHPGGQPLKLSTQDNWVKAVKGDRVLYLTGTEKGSSGSPVFNDQWELVALHHSGSPIPPSNFPGKIEANEGIVMKAILDDLAQQSISVN